jgi:protein SCO1/2
MDEDVGIDEQLGSYLPKGLGFLEANGDSVYLDELIDKPVVLTLVYYHCPSICMPLLNGVAEVVEKTDLDPGKDYRVVTVSFDPYDNPKTAGRVKDNIIATLGDRLPKDSWLFLTADSTTIDRLTDAVGFHVKRVDKDFAHGSALIFIAPDGKVVRYLYGLVYAPFDLKMAVAEASQGKVVPSISRVLKFCFSYDPEGRQYVFNITRVVGGLVLVFAAVFVISISVVGRKRKKEERA